ncbi:hypothetical protein H1C71_015001 [Ictidomys tridecemlineatus]|nr:hypothetical protein H1C71_015001 [Ictidomys tridecemlineatus]
MEHTFSFLWLHDSERHQQCESKCVEGNNVRLILHVKLVTRHGAQQPYTFRHLSFPSPPPHPSLHSPLHDPNFLRSSLPECAYQRKHLAFVFWGLAYFTSTIFSSSIHLLANATPFMIATNRQTITTTNPWEST